MVQKSVSIEISCCCARTEADQEYLKQLKTHLEGLRKKSIGKSINLWDESKITGGDLWAREIQNHLRDARIILLLISPDFMNSHYSDEYVKVYLEQHKQRTAQVIPVIVRPTVGWEDISYKGLKLGDLQALPTGAKDIASLNPDSAWKNVVNGIERVILTFSPLPAELPEVVPQSPRPMSPASPIIPPSGPRTSSAVNLLLPQQLEETPILPVSPPSPIRSVASTPEQHRPAPLVNRLNRWLARCVNRLNIDWGALALLLLIVAIVTNATAPASSDQLTFANNLATTAYYLALIVFCGELYVITVHKQWRWSRSVGLAVVGIAFYLLGIIFSWGGLVYDLIAVLLPLALWGLCFAEDPRSQT